LKADEKRCSDQIIFARITNDERPLRRVIKKFHGYTSLSHPPIVPPITPNGSSSLEDAREAFLVDLASFQLLMKKSAMICEAEARQVEEYQRERGRLGELLHSACLYMPALILI
jgi:THO complex subunit 7